MRLRSHGSVLDQERSRRKEGSLAQACWSGRCPAIRAVASQPPRERKSRPLNIVYNPRNSVWQIRPYVCHALCRPPKKHPSLSRSSSADWACGTTHFASNDRHTARRRGKTWQIVAELSNFFQHPYTGVNAVLCVTCIGPHWPGVEIHGMNLESCSAESRSVLATQALEWMIV
jgi:hypothetical protein